MLKFSWAQRKGGVDDIQVSNGVVNDGQEDSTPLLSTSPSVPKSKAKLYGNSAKLSDPKAIENPSHFQEPDNETFFGERTTSNKMYDSAYRNQLTLNANAMASVG
jgi:hypothetical protein